jgi:transcriptional regulator with XRE-family HTH domain
MDRPIDDPALMRLGEFLRGRRLSAPSESDVVPARRRRRPSGKRREEIAARAGISYDWYARIELGRGAIPSVATLLAIGRALELNDVDTRYLFELAGLPVPAVPASRGGESLVAIEHVILNVNATAATLFDAYGSPLCWNEISDGLFRWSTRRDAFERNSIVYGLSDPYLPAFFGADYENVARGVIGMFRRAYTTARQPSELARRVYEFGLEQPLFVQIWAEHSVADAYTPPGPFDRFHPTLGLLRLDYADVAQSRRADMFVRFLAPHDDHTRAKFAQLQGLGTASRLLLPDE